MSGVPIERLPHSCGTRSGLQVFAQEDGTVDGWCFSCETHVADPYGDGRKAKDIKIKVKTPEEIQEEIDFIGTLPVLPYPERKLKEKPLEYYDIRVGLSEEDGKTPRVMYFPYRKKGVITGYKAELMNSDAKNKRWTVGDVKDCDLFGWKEAIATGSKRLYITEGEKDAVSLKSVLERYAKEGFKGQAAVVSLTKGAGNAKADITRSLQAIKEHFKEVVLVFDMDEAGDNAVASVSSVLPIATRASLPENDPNACVMEGKSQALFKACAFNSTRPKNSRLVFAEDLHDEAREPAKWGELSLPWYNMNDTTRGIRIGETWYWGAGVKMGKSEILNALAAHHIVEDNVKVFMAKPEEANKKSYKMIAGKVTGNVFHDPKVQFDYDAYDRAGKVLSGHLAMVNLYQHLGWESLQQDILAAVEWGAKAVFIDPITNLTNGMAASDANTQLQAVAQEISAMALDHGFVAHLFCHLKAPEGDLQLEVRKKRYEKGQYIGIGNCPHEKGGIINSSQFAGSRAMMRSCNYMIGIEGNKDDALSEHVRNTRHIRLLEDREFGEAGVFPVQWSRETSLFSEI